MINLSKIEDKELYGRLWSVLNGDSIIHIEPQFYDKNIVYISTGQSYGNVCLYNWWKLKKWFTDNKIEFTETGDGTPSPEQKACDFISYITEKDDAQETDKERAESFRIWLFKNISFKRIDNAAKAIGITREEILNNKTVLEECKDLLKEK